MRAIEFFSGIGGWHCAIKGMGYVVSAFDISQVANDVYSFNFGTSPQVRELATISASEIRILEADTWLMSPPCQPYCRMGKCLDLQDQRSAAFKNLMKVLAEYPPRRLVLENVEGFLKSSAFEMLTKLLDRKGMNWSVFTLCPTQFGIPNRRPRVFVVAGADGVKGNPLPDLEPGPLSDYLDDNEDGSLYLSDEIITRHSPGLDIVTSASCRSACFIGGYGKRLVGSGSFLKTPAGIRRFSPGEISRLMGFPPQFRFPNGISVNNQFKLLGNSLNLVVAEWVLKQIN